MFYAVKDIPGIPILQVVDYYYVTLSLKYLYNKYKIILNAQKIVIVT